MFNKYKTDWCTRMDSCGRGSKLRTYKLFKFSYCTEQYLLQNIPIFVIVVPLPNLDVR